MWNNFYWHAPRYVVAVKHIETTVNLSTLFDSTMHFAAKSTTKLFANFLRAATMLRPSRRRFGFAGRQMSLNLACLFTSRQFFFVNSTSTLFFAKIVCIFRIEAAVLMRCVVWLASFDQDRETCLRPEENFLPIRIREKLCSLSVYEECVNLWDEARQNDEENLNLCWVFFIFIYNFSGTLVLACRVCSAYVKFSSFLFCDSRA